jgi:hypothetical protein
MALGDLDLVGELGQPRTLSAIEAAHWTVQGLAARDEDRHPLSVPPDLGPAQA